jgi:ATP-dependent DNA ligase
MSRAATTGDRRPQVSELVDPRFEDRLRPAAAEFMAPMLSTLTGTYFSDSGWLFERKLDGVRALHNPSRGLLDHHM